MGRQNELRAAALAMKDLLVKRLAMTACGCHGSNKILFFSRLRRKAHSLMARAILTNQRLTIGRETHPPAAFWAHETLHVCNAQAFRCKRQLVWIDEFVRFELAFQNRKRFASTRVLQVVCQAILKRLV